LSHDSSEPDNFVRDAISEPTDPGTEGAASSQHRPSTNERRRYAGLRILVIGVDSGSRKPLARTLSTAGMQVLEAAPNERALALVAGCEPDVVVIARSVPSHDLEWAQRLISASRIGDRVIILRDRGDHDDRRLATRLGVARCLIMPVRAEQLVGAVREVQRRALSAYSDRDRPPRDGRQLTFSPVADVTLARIAETFVDAFNRRDREAWRAVFHPCAAFRPTLLIGRRAVYRGHDGVALYMDQLIRDGQGREARIRELRRMGDDRFVLLADVLVDGEFLSPAAVLVRLEGEKIIEATAYLSDWETLEAMQMIPKSHDCGS